MNQIYTDTSKISRILPTELNFQAIIVVYKTLQGYWKGFAHPFGETTEADTKTEAIQKMRDLTDAYISILKQYEYPTHLVNGGLTDVNDREVFSHIFATKKAMEKLHSTEGKLDTELYYAEAYRV